MSIDTASRQDYMQCEGSLLKRTVRATHNHIVHVMTLFWTYLVLPLLQAVQSVLLFVANITVMPLFALIQKSPAYPVLLEFFTEHRGWVLVGTVLPLSFLFDHYFRVRNWYYRHFLSAPHLHDVRVREVQRQVCAWNEAGRQKPMVTARPPWLAMSLRVESFKESCEKIKINLHDILEVDTARMTVRCEPLVDMGQITRHLIPMGYALSVMIEMDDLTVGGLLMGVGVEVSSHIYGFLSETVVAYEVVLGDGSLVRCTREENADLFHALPWSHGTLGFLVAAELKIVPVKPYVHVKYIPCHTQDEYANKLSLITHAPNTPEFVEATIYSRETAVIFTGDFSDGPPASQKHKINHVGRWWKPWFYKHVESFLEKGEDEEWIPLRQYYHRHTRSIFWELREVIPFCNAWWYRWVFGWLGAPKIAFIKLTSTPAVREASVYSHVVQDLVVPLTELKNAVNLYDDAFDVYPLLFYPVRIYKQDDGYQGMLHTPRNLRTAEDGRQYEMYCDLGVYGVPPKVKNKQPWDAIAEVRRIEKFARDVNGYQLLYADCFMTRDEFETVSMCPAHRAAQ
ncbi:24-dehydrocholesterol reductase [Syncephalis pseudoplumigaleata]|uniref:Delta(24)-sterol reductase n=1 Tax=Syncephalis pseudoplumigaleata TaxID=1712513 RepID=A0A4V1J0Y3_9FUNG|nr:24-dehydrocholesterol reductase [Syncephalis pseudoplumigaleata]|eukprot:RKP23159.1 24-dehydrocholesterol reductase [Syncephalis pseudoplumigaleata]